MTDFNIEPPEFSDKQLDQWCIDAPFFREGVLTARYHWLCKAAIAWATPIVAKQAADAELEACCAWLRQRGVTLQIIEQLRAARRPKPKSLKELALDQLTSLHSDLTIHGLGANTDTIRRALESIPDEPTTP